jgi:methyltransferase (TIGR00027 family)
VILLSYALRVLGESWQALRRVRKRGAGAVRDGEASVTAQRVAAQRVTFDRVPAPYGDPVADERLSRDVAGESVAALTERMVAYLAARTGFFDRAVVTALGRGVTQVVVVGAGYDGRAWRYAKPGVRWFEVDHPDTQGDKRQRVHRLGLDCNHVTFVPADFVVDKVGSRLGAAGLDRNRPSLMVCEGVAAYLDRPVLAALVAGMGEVAAPRSRLAISVSLATGSSDLAARRAEFQARVAAFGEPVRAVLTADDASRLLAAAGWRIISAAPDTGPARRRERDAGFVTAEPVRPR